jgi:hypothetical protein
MPWDLVWAPLEFAVVGSSVWVALGLHLRRLGRDAAGESAEGPDPPVGRPTLED